MRMRNVCIGAACGASALATFAGAEVINLNVNGNTLSNMNGVVTGRLRFDAGGGVDHMLFKQPNPAGFPATDRLRMNSSNNGSASYVFSLSHNAAANSFTFALTQGTVTGGASFASSGNANGTLTRTFSAGELSYNILHIYMLTDSGATASFSNLAFTAGPGLTTSGSLLTSGSATNASYDQWLAANTGVNLNNFDWSMSGNVTLAMNGTKPSAERLKFEISAKEGTFIPAPGSLAMVGGLGLIAARRRRRST